MNEYDEIFMGEIPKNEIVIGNAAYLSCDSDIDFERIIRQVTLEQAPARFGGRAPAPVAVFKDHVCYLEFPRHTFDVISLDKDAAAILTVRNIRKDFEGLYDKYDFQHSVQLRPSQFALWYGDSEYTGLEAADNGKLIAAPGKGKTELGLLKAATRGFATLVLVTNGGLAVQWKERAMLRLGLKEDEIGMIVGGIHLEKKKSETLNRWERPLVIAIVDSIEQNRARLPAKYKERFGTILLDEAHHMPSETFNDVVNLFVGERFALTADADRDDGLGPIVGLACGRTVALSVTPDVPAEVSILPTQTRSTDFRKSDIYVGKSPHLSKVHTALATATTRNKLITALADAKYAEGKPTIVLAHTERHPENLRELSKYRDSAVVITGETSFEDRIALLKTSNLIFATLGVAAEGLDKAELECVIYATPFVSRRIFKQGKGRAERFGRTGKAPEVIVVVDPLFEFIKQHNNALFSFVGLQCRL